MSSATFVEPDPLGWVSGTSLSGDLRELTTTKICSLLYITQYSGSEIGLPGRILAGLLPGKQRNGPSGRPSAGRRADIGVFLVAVRPKSAPEGRFTARKHYCVTSLSLGYAIELPGQKLLMLGV